MHRALGAPTTRLEHEQRLAEWLRALIESASAVRPLRSPLNPHDDQALRWAYDYLADQPERNAGLDERAPPVSGSSGSSASSASTPA